MDDARVIAEDDVEEVDALPIVSATAPVAPSPAGEPGRGLVTRSAGQVVAQAAAVAVTSFAAGAVATAVVRKARGAAKPARRPGARERGVEVVATRTFLVDVHLLGSRE